MFADKIESLVVHLATNLLKQKWTISCAESCTGGGLAFAFTSVDGSSNWFERSFVTYSNQAKHELLQVEQTTLDTFGAVSQQTVEQMALGCAKVSKANLAVSISGIAGPNGGSTEKPVGLVWFGFYCQGQITSTSRIFTGNRHQVRMQAIQFALEQSILVCEGE
ncbi:CinA family protein [Aliiglaciecola sp. LCG003]|uniref:CinA family protein n=1 Tax=Aliiglaciecola sp. LCG003 TaxID=3053655 RepID=UPI0025730E83|nr:CinA family protein [Aliiglaciecola sp. LCG003]WJG08608.1 CinA family protein [Aliiglaciecola sp. LCG003]